MCDRVFPIQAAYFDPENKWGSDGNNCPHIERYKVNFPRFVPWDHAERAYKVYSRLYGTSQSLERLDERAGFGVYEFVFYYYDEIAGYKYDWSKRFDLIDRYLKENCILNDTR